MNSLFLLAAMAAAFAFGYRFYAKLLALDVFRLDERSNTPAQARADSRDYVPTHPQLLLGHQVAAAAGGAVFAAPVVALGWGWVPAFLWITIGSAVAAGTYCLGSFWLAARHSENAVQLGRRLIGRPTRLALLVLMLAALALLIAAAAGLAATLLARFPGAALPLVAVAVLAAGFGSYLHGRAESELLPATVVAIGGALLFTWLLGRMPLAFDGAVVISVAGAAWLTIDATFVWVVLLFVYAVHAARLPVWRLMRPRAFLTSLLLGVLLAMFYAALALRHPLLVAPEFHAPEPDAGGSLPGIFLLVGVGALAGWQLLIVHGVTGRELRRETDARYVGYGSALVHGLIALSALLLGATAFATPEEWARHFDAAPSAADLPAALVFYVNALAVHLDALGLDPVSARALGATVIAGLALALLEAGVRALKHLLADTAPALAPASGSRDSERRRLWLIAAAGAAVALHDGRGLGGIAAWPLLAMTSLWLAAAGFAVMAAVLAETGRPGGLLAALAAAAAIVAGWATVWQLLAWWRADTWIGLAAGLVVLAAALVLLYEAGAAWRRARVPRQPEAG